MGFQIHQSNDISNKAKYNKKDKLQLDKTNYQERVINHMEHNQYFSKLEIAAH